MIYRDSKIIYNTYKKLKNLIINILQNNKCTLILFIMSLNK